MKRTLGQEPFIFQLVALLAADKAEENEFRPFTSGIIVLSMTVAGVGALIYGTISGVIPW